MIPGLCQNGKCMNIRGGHRCMCNVGYKLTMDAKRCLGKGKVIFMFYHLPYFPVKSKM